MKNKRKKKLTRCIIFLIFLVIVMFIVFKFFIKGNKEEGKQSTQIKEENNLNINEKYVQLLNDGTKINESEKLKKDKQFENLKLSNIQLKYKNGITNLLCDVENVGKKEIKEGDIIIILRDKEGQEIYRLDGFLEKIKPGEIKEFNTSVTADFSNAYDFTIIKK